MGHNGGQKDQRRGAQLQRLRLTHRGQHQISPLVLLHPAHPVQQHDGHSPNGEQPQDPGLPHPQLRRPVDPQVEGSRHAPPSSPIPAEYSSHLRNSIPCFIQRPIRLSVCSIFLSPFPVRALRAPQRPSFHADRPRPSPVLPLRGRPPCHCYCTTAPARRKASDCAEEICCLPRACGSAPPRIQAWTFLHRCGIIVPLCPEPSGLPLILQKES